MVPGTPQPLPERVALAGVLGHRDLHDAAALLLVAPHDGHAGAAGFHAERRCAIGRHRPGQDLHGDLGHVHAKTPLERFVDQLAAAPDLLGHLGVLRPQVELQAADGRPPPGHAAHGPHAQPARSCLAAEQVRETGRCADVTRIDDFEATFARVLQQLGRRPHPVHVGAIRPTREHARANAPAALDEAEFLELPQRVTDHVPADPEILRQLQLAGQRGADPQLPAVDPADQFIGNLAVSSHSSLRPGTTAAIVRTIAG